MKINIQNAVKKFFPTPSLELVYFEAIANAIDANASVVKLSIQIESMNGCETLYLVVEDNGVGFTNERFEKFTQLLSTDTDDRKGIGRLVFLEYFENVSFVSELGKTKRVFEFNDSFNGRKTDSDNFSESTSTKVEFRRYRKTKIGKADYIDIEYLINAIRLHFYPVFLNRISNGKDLEIQVETTIGKLRGLVGPQSRFEKLSGKDFPKFKSVTFSIPEFNSLFPFELKYSIEAKQKEKVFLTLVNVDDRTIELDLIAKSNFPADAHILFLMESFALKGKTNNSRVDLELNEQEERGLREAYIREIKKILEQEIPDIKKHNEEKVTSIEQNYPHLNGYFNIDEIGLVDENAVIDAAQKAFFKEQKEVLQASELTDDQFEKTLAQSSRLLTEYILYRTKIISKLKKISPLDKEETIHNLIVPKRTILGKENHRNDIFLNNAWILDDKYMNYQVILSEQDMSSLLKHIGIPNDEKLDGRPDIAIVMSNVPESDAKADVIIVELKRLGIDLAGKEELISQLKQRARNLLRYYSGKVQRVWFYGIVDVDAEFQRSMIEEEFTPLYSNGSVHYKEHQIITDKNDFSQKVPMGIFILDYNALILDAESRNQCFLELLKASFKKSKMQSEIG